jgi:hypothetical protein
MALWPGFRKTMASRELPHASIHGLPRRGLLGNSHTAICKNGAHLELKSAFSVSSRGICYKLVTLLDKDAPDCTKGVCEVS